MNFFTTPTGIAVIAGVSSFVAGVLGAGISSWTIQRTHGQRLAADEKLAERRFAYEKELAERKFKYDRDLHDHKRRVELAEAILAEFLQMGDVIRAIRSPAILPGEAVGRQRRENETEEEARNKDLYFVPLTRMSENREFLSGLMSKRYRSRALLGDNIDEAFEAVREAIIEIQVSASTLMDMVGMGQIDFEKDEKRWLQCKADIWGGAVGEDRVGPMVKRAIDIVDSVCRPILEKNQPT